MKKKLIVSGLVAASLLQSSSSVFAAPFDEDTDVNVNYGNVRKFNDQAEYNSEKMNQDNILMRLNNRLDELRALGRDAVKELSENGFAQLDGVESRTFTNIEDLENYINESIEKVKDAISKRTKALMGLHDIKEKIGSYEYIDKYKQLGVIRNVTYDRTMSFEDAIARIEEYKKIDFEKRAWINKEVERINKDVGFVNINGDHGATSSDRMERAHSVEEYNQKLDEIETKLIEHKKVQDDYDSFTTSIAELAQSQGYNVQIDPKTIEKDGGVYGAGPSDMINTYTSSPSPIDVKAGLTSYLEKQKKAIDEYNQSLAEYNEKKAEYDTAKADYDAKMLQYEEDKTNYEAEKQRYDEALSEYNFKKAEHAQKKQNYDNAKVEYERKKAKYDQKLAEWQANKVVKNQDEIDRVTSENERIERENAQIRTEYEQALEDYNQNYKPKNTDTKIGGSDDTIAMYDTNKPTGGKDYYSKYVFNENKTATNSVDLLKPISITSDSKFGGTETSILKQGENQVEFTFNTVNDYLTLSNVGKVKVNGEVKDLSLKIEGVASDSLVGKKFVVHKIASLYQDTLALNTTQLSNNDLKITFIADDKPVNLAGGLLIKSIDYDQESKVEWENQVFDYVDINANLNKTAKGYRAKVNEKWNGNLPENSYMSVGYGSYVSVHHSTGVIQLFGAGSGDTKPNFGKPVEPEYAELKTVPEAIMESDENTKPVAPSELTMTDPGEFTDEKPVVPTTPIAPQRPTEPKKPVDKRSANGVRDNDGRYSGFTSRTGPYGGYNEDTDTTYILRPSHYSLINSIAFDLILPDASVLENLSNKYIGDVVLNYEVDKLVLRDKISVNDPEITFVNDPSNLTDDEIDKVIAKIKKANSDYTDAVSISVTNDGNVTISEDDKISATLTPDKVIAEKGVFIPNAPNELTLVDDMTAFSEDEKAEIIRKIKEANSDYANDMNIVFNDDMGVSISVPDMKDGTLSKDQIAREKDTLSGNLPDVFYVDDENQMLTVEDKAKITESLKKNNPSFDDSYDIDVKDNGDIIVSVSDKKPYNISKDQYVKVREEFDVNLPELTVVEDKTNLTADEIETVKRKLKESNPNFTDDTIIDVKSDGSAVISEIGKKDKNISSDELVREKEMSSVKPFEKTFVDNMNKLTDDEKEKVKIEIRKANDNFDENTVIDVADDGNVTVTELGKKPVRIPSSDVITEKDVTSFNEFDLTQVENKDALTDDEKAKVISNIRKSNPDYTDDTLIVVSDNGNVTITDLNKKPIEIPSDKVVYELESSVGGSDFPVVDLEDFDEDKLSDIIDKPDLNLDDSDKNDKNVKPMKKVVKRRIVDTSDRNSDFMNLVVMGMSGLMIMAMKRKKKEK